MRFITYRNNIRFDSIGLKVKRDDNKYEHMGNLRVFMSLLQMVPIKPFVKHHMSLNLKGALIVKLARFLQKVLCSLKPLKPLEKMEWTKKSEEK
jgi:hypothetical protein